ncbi:MAG TPA: nuclease, partial [Actinomycetes bacterium]|nr:nuclease [Actinomycetes bacterium]
LTRTVAAQELAEWLATMPTKVTESDQLIIGDLNSYAKEDPIAALEATGFTNMIAAKIGAKTYSYVFDGQSGYLDHALASPSLAAQVTGVTEWHINADEPTVLDYNVEFKSAAQVAAYYEADPFRSSDHDPVLVGLSLAPQGDKTPR